jgi:hypothetical protein
VLAAVQDFGAANDRIGSTFGTRRPGSYVSFHRLRTWQLSSRSLIERESGKIAVDCT